MIWRVYLKELLSFPSIELELSRGLVVLSGPSGAGKSVFINAILANFGIGNSEAKLCEIELDKPNGLSSDMYDLDSQISIRSIKKDRARHYIDSQNISKKQLGTIFAPYVNYLSVRDGGGFESERLIKMFDRLLIAKDKSFGKMLKEYKQRYLAYRQKLLELEKIQEDEKKLAELVEFATFEVERIKSIDPKDGEDDKLLLIKKQLSKIEKIDDAISRSEKILELENAVDELYILLDKDTTFWTDAMNQLRVDLEDAEQYSRELEGMDVGELLDRLEKINELKNRYGSISEILEYKNKKEKELEGYGRIEQDKSMLESFLQLELTELSIVAGYITQSRIKQSKETAIELEKYLAKLKLPAVSFEFSSIELGELGLDSIDLKMRDSHTSTLSGGEHNRLRLALMAVMLGDAKDAIGGIIVLDEIDANVSGDESIAIADMISKLSKGYQIFAISHQPHLSAKADQHILIDRIDDESSATVLDEKGRIGEIARIIGGEIPNAEAVAFAKKLLG